MVALQTKDPQAAAVLGRTSPMEARAVVPSGHRLEGYTALHLAAFRKDFLEEASAEFWKELVLKVPRGS